MVAVKESGEKTFLYYSIVEENAAVPGSEA